jgi:hypothetical protein
VYGAKLDSLSDAACETRASRQLFDFMLDSFEAPAAEDGVRVVDLLMTPCGRRAADQPRKPRIHSVASQSMMPTMAQAALVPIV